MAELLAERGMAATFYINSNLVGSAPALLDWDDVASIGAIGHEVGGHGGDHLDLTTLDADACFAQISADRTALVAHGHRAASFAYPYGAFNPQVERLVEASGFAAARRAWGLASQRSIRDRPMVELLPPHERYAIRTIPSIERDTSFETLTGLVARAARCGGWLPLVFHRISDGSSTYELAPATFERFVDWLRGERRRIAVETVTGVLER